MAVPYFYDGDLAYERLDLLAYRNSNRAILFGAFDGDLLVSASTGSPLEEHAGDFTAALGGHRFFEIAKRMRAHWDLSAELIARLSVPPIIPISLQATVRLMPFGTLGAMLRWAALWRGWILGKRRRPLCARNSGPELCDPKERALRA